MNEPGPVTSDESRAARRVFVSFSSTNRKKALDLCASLEARGVPCWISCRDVAAGENYQEAIVRAIKGARAMVLVFSKAANSSDEIKKELSLASREKLPVIAVRIENAQPTDAFAYELSTRQWIDAFKGWDKASDAIVASLDRVAGESMVRRGSSRRAPVYAAAILALLIVALGAWYWLRPDSSPAEALQVRLGGFQRLSADLPATLPDTMREELIAAFGDDGIVRVSTATAPSAGSAPDYLLGGTMRRDGDKVKVIARLTNQRTGTTLWTNDYALGASQLDRIPRRVAVDVSMIARCGLFGASTYRGKLPEPALADYFHYCQSAGDEPDKALDFARKVVAAVPDFSWGLSAVEIAGFNAVLQGPAEPDAPRLRQEALSAADKAIRLDPTNSEAYAFKSQLIDPGDLAQREKLLKQAVHARALPCGCEHHFYGDFLMEVGRTNDAVVEYRRAIDILALNADSQVSLAQAYLASRRPDLAREHFDAAFELDSDPRYAAQIKAALAPITGDYAGALKVLNDPDHGAPTPIRPTLSAAFSALISRNPAAEANAAAQLQNLPPPARNGMYVNLLGALGANRAALDGVTAAALVRKRAGARSWLFSPPLSGALRDPSFPGVADRLGLIAYWRGSKTKPDVCSEKSPPPFCRTI